MLNILLGFIIIIGGIAAVAYTSYRITRFVIYRTIVTIRKVKYRIRKMEKA
jgi:hypothetical protein